MTKSNDINLFNTIDLVWSKRVLILLVTGFFLVISILYALLAPNLYTSSALLKVSDGESNQIDSLVSDYGGLASMAGISLPSSSDNKGPFIISVIRSKEFLKHLLTFEKVKLNLMAVQNYNKDTKKIVYDNNKFDFKNKKWIRDFDDGRSQNPSYVEVSEVYNESINVWQDDKTSFIYIDFTHESPIFANDFLNLIIKEINSQMRSQDLKESEESLEYLYQLLDKTSDNDLRDLVFNLIETQLKTQMLANIQEDYVFRKIDSPFLPEKTSSPNRYLIILIGCFFGLLVSILYILMNVVFTNRTSNQIS
jgi:uncharacterized protein involved in exopolysaccharide biosynthesis